jgi:uncharacterized membrane protein YdjX (TVP38/TMEM64 family)
MTEPAPISLLDHVLFRAGPVDVTRRLLLQALFVATGVIALSFLWGRIDLADLHARAHRLPGVAVVAAITLLPLVGFPVSWLHLVAGVRFEFAGGMLVVAITSVLHHVLGWALTRLLPAHLFRRLEPWRLRLLGAGHREATLLCCLMPGMPYTVQLYLMPVIGVPFSLMFGLSAALHAARAIVTILLGDMSDNLTPVKLAALAVYYCALFAATALALRGLRRSLARKTAISR